MLKRSPIVVLFILMLSVVPVMAQLSCPQIVQQALLAVGDNCNDLARNTACYGYQQVDATFAVDVPTNYFTAPSERASLVELATLRTYPVDSANQQWGIAVMNIEANLPKSVPGQGVVLMLIGDAEVSNDVPAESANMIPEPLSTATVAEANLYASPSTTANIINILPANSIVLVDGLNATQGWLRVVNDGTIAWIERDKVARLAAMDTLPIIGASNPTPMQAFYLSTGIGASECTEADPMIAVQSPENIVVDLTVNGVDIRVGSLVTFQNKDVNTINMTVHRGKVNTVFGNTINAGESAIGVINLEAVQGDVIVAWGEAIPATEEDLQLGERAQQAINNVARNNGWDERQVEPNPPEEPQGELIHIVQTGETLFGIGRLYDASLPEIVARNNLTAPYTLFRGQELVIPNPGSGFVGLPSSRPPVVQQPPSTGDETPPTICSTLRLTSPLSSVPTEAVPYYWDGVVGATQYQVNIFDQATGQLMGSLFTEAAETSLTISAGGLSVGGAMQWQVIALRNGQPICDSGLSQPITHSPPASSGDDNTINEEEFSISWKCTGYFELTVYWENAMENEKVDFKVKQSNGSTHNQTSRGENGSIRVNGISNFVSATAETESGDTDKLSGDLNCM